MKKELPGEGYDEILTPGALRVVAEAFVGAGEAARRQEDEPTTLRFGLQLGSYTHKGGRATTGEWVRRIGARRRWGVSVGR